MNHQNFNALEWRLRGTYDESMPRGHQDGDVDEYSNPQYPLYRQSIENRGRYRQVISQVDREGGIETTHDVNNDVLRDAMAANRDGIVERFGLESAGYYWPTLDELRQAQIQQFQSPGESVQLQEEYADFMRHQNEQLLAIRDRRHARRILLGSQRPANNGQYEHPASMNNSNEQVIRARIPNTRLHRTRTHNLPSTTCPTNAQDLVDDNLLSRREEIAKFQFPTPGNPEQHYTKMESEAFQMYLGKARRIHLVNGIAINYDFEDSIRMVWDSMSDVERFPYVATAKYRFFTQQKIDN